MPRKSPTANESKVSIIVIRRIRTGTRYQAGLCFTVPAEFIFYRLHQPARPEVPTCFLNPQS